jgi:hypothetical protein
MAFGSKRMLELILGADNRKLRSKLRESKKDLQGFAKDAQGSLKSAFAAGAGAFAGFASVQGIASLSKTVLANEESLERLGIQAGISGKRLDEVRATAVATGREFGMSTADVLGAAAAIIDLEGASGFSAAKMRVLSKAAVATGADVKQLAGLAFSLNNAFGLENAEDLEAMLSAVTAAGKQGSVPLAEMSTVLQQIGTKFARIAPQGKEGAAQLSAAIQVARKGFGSAAEVGTGIKAFVDQLDQSAPKLAAFGVKVFDVGKDGRKQLKPMTEIFDQLGKSQLIKDPFLMTQVFGSSEARQFINTLVQNRDQFNELAAAALSANDVQEDSQRFLASSAGRLKVATASARASLEAMVTPERLEKFVDIVQNQLVPALDWTLDNAKQIAMVIATWKLAGVIRSAATFGASLVALTAKAGGLSAALKGAGLSMGGIVAGALRFAGPIGIAATGVWALHAAYKATRQEAKALSREEIERAEREGRRLKGASKFDPTGQAAARRALATRTRKDIEDSNAAVFRDDFEDQASRNIEFLSRNTYDSEGKRARGARMLELRRKFIENQGVLAEDEFAELEAAMKEFQMIKGVDRLAAGSRGVQAETEARKLEAEAAAISEVERLRFGQAEFSAAGLDLGRLADEAGVTDPEQRKAFMAQALRTLTPTGGVSLAATRGQVFTGEGDRRVLDTLSPELRARRLAVDDEGRVVEREESVGLFSRQGMGMAREALMDDKARDDMFKGLTEAMRAALAENIVVAIDGREVFTSVHNSPEQRRAPAQ